jgi:hypothetical protein
MSQSNYKPHYEHLKNKWQDRHRELQKEILAKHGEAFYWLTHHLRNFSVGAIGALLLTFNQPGAVVSAATQTVQEQPKDTKDALDKNVFLVYDLSNLVPRDVRKLSPEEEERIAGILTSRFGFPVKAEIDGKRLNTSYGYIGAEQHLARYPGDSMATHFTNPEDAQLYTSSGMAPGLGAWRYFAPSRSELTQKETDEEKYYIAVQTFLSPGFHDNPKAFSDFYKFRKMIVINPQNGRAMVCVVGDAGPAEWTGKSLGGSPEVMSYLERVDGRARGGVLYFFVDDPNDTIPLGPVSVT